MSLAKPSKGAKSDAHPLHPALVHFPIAFFVSAQLLDIAYGLTTHPKTAQHVSAAYNLKPYLSDIARLGHLFTILGILSAIPSVLTGATQLLALLSRQDYANKVQKSNGSGKALANKTHPKVTTAFAHAATMDLITGAMVYNWYTRRSNPLGAPSDLNVLISAVAAPVFLTSAYLGAALVYRHGVGVEPQAVWAKKAQ